MQNQRNTFLDLIKGFTIILVVLGHCIQEGSGNDFSAQTLYFSDKLYQFIYSFHMPLFAMVSGYLCWGSIRRAGTGKECLSLLERRTASLLIPVFFWNTAEYVHNLILYPSKEPLLKRLFQYLYSMLNNLWFLWAIFWCFLIVYVMHCFLKDNIVIYLLGLAAMFFLPDGLNLGAYKYLLPFYLAAFYAHGYLERKKNALQWIAHPRTLFLSGLIFAVLFAFYKEDSFIYLSGYKLIGREPLRQLLIDAYRMLVGFAGSIFFLLFWYNVTKYLPFKGKLLTELGRKTMGIYIFSGYLTLLVIKRLTVSLKPSYFWNIAETVFVLFLSWGLTSLLQKSALLRRTVGK